MALETPEQPFADWIGRRSEAEDIVTPRLVAGFRAIFGGALAGVGGDEAPLGLHWCLSPAIAAMDALGADGHPAKNRDLPPIPLPRRMWAGGRLETVAPLRIGDAVRRVSTLAGINRKQGRSGELWFLAIDHLYETDRGPAIRERQDIVYREAATPGAAPASPASRAPAASAAGPDDWTVETPPTLLFRYSAITFNGHRIHYDLPYATGEEGYPGLVVHGPLQATLLFNRAAAALGHAPRAFAYRGVAPAIAGSPLLVRRLPDEPSRLRTEGPQGTVHMEATIEDQGQGGSP